MPPFCLGAPFPLLSWVLPICLELGKPRETMELQGRDVGRPVRCPRRRVQGSMPLRVTQMKPGRSNPTLPFIDEETEGWKVETPCSRVQGGAPGRAGTRTPLCHLQLQGGSPLPPIKCVSKWLSEFITPTLFLGCLLSVNTL